MIDKSLTFQHETLEDGGPRYFETDFNLVIVEPFNMISAALFLIIVAYWIYVLRGRFTRHKFLAVAVPILAIGGIGGTIYHGFRTAQFFLVMDWLPILILSLMACFYFTHLATKKRWVGAVLIIFVFVAHESIHAFLRPSIANNLAYTLLALTIMIPLLAVVFKSNGKHAKWVTISLVSFCIALGFRMADPFGLLPMGTHFLWHLFGAIACHAMFVYIFKLNRWRRLTGKLAV